MFEAALSLFVRSHVGVHFASADEAAQALRAAGFSRASVLRASEHAAAPQQPGAALVRVVEAR